MSAQKPREIAVQLLRRQPNQAFVEDRFDHEMAQRSLAPADRALCQELVFGIIRWQRTLDWLVERKTGGRPQNATLQALLWLGLYQLFWLDRIPDHAAVHETVELAKKFGFAPKAGFLNAVLRGYIREREATAEALEQLKKTAPATGYSHPDWLVERWRARWGETRIVQLLEWNNSPPPTYARVNTLKIDAARLAEKWKAEGVEFSSCEFPWVDAGLVFQLKSHPSLAKLESLRQGWFYIQDPSTLFAVRQLEPKASESILDFCAAPGGKATFMAQLMQNRGRVLALDPQPGRLQILEENCARLGATCVTTSLLASAPEKEDAFDRILIDAPCSNTGVLRRRIEARWRVRPEELDRLRQTQISLLKSAVARLKPGGTIVYSTCSLEPEENESVVADFIREQPAFTVQSQTTLLPFVDGVDGAFAAVLRFGK